MRTKVSLLVSILTAGLASALMAQDAKLNGHWEGAIVFTAAEQEVDVVVDFSGAGEQLKGQLQFPMTADGMHEVESIALQGGHASFSVRDKGGVVSAFDGVLSPDGASLQGTLTEAGKPFPFTLRRAEEARPPREAAAVRLAGDGIPLKAAFNEDVDKTRILLLLNLGSFSSKMALRVVERYVMEQIDNPGLRVYVVWMARDVPDLEKFVRESVALTTDPRITHFWSTDAALAKSFEPMLAPYMPVSNPCLLFAPDKSWAAAAPVPDKVRQSARVGAKGQVNPAQKLNGIELAMDVQLLLGTKKAVKSAS